MNPDRVPNPDDDLVTRLPFRVLTYSHDSFGLGHLRRSVTLAGALVARGPDVSAVCLTGSPVPNVFALPERCDLVKLPSIGKDEHGDYVGRRLPLPIGEITALRSDVITATVRALRPDLLLVDHTAAGPGGELLPVLRRLRHEQLQTRVVLGLRDVLDTPWRARAELQRLGTFAVVRDCYDHVLVYGDRDVFDPVREYGFPDDIAAKTSFTGPVVPPEARARRHARATGAPPHVVVTTGGGEDGYELLRGTVAALRGPLRDERLRATIVAGPMLDDAAFTALRRAVQGDLRLVLLRSTDAMHTLLGTADLVVGMGGYNTVYESLARGVPLLAWPRSAPREEQAERCRRLAARGLLHQLTVDALRDPRQTAGAITAALAAGTNDPPDPVRCDGAAQAARLLLRQRRQRVASSDHLARLG